MFRERRVGLWLLYTVSQEKTVLTDFLFHVCQILTDFNKNLNASHNKSVTNMRKMPTSPKVCACTTLGNSKCEIKVPTQ